MNRYPGPFNRTTLMLNDSKNSSITSRRCSSLVFLAYHHQRILRLVLIRLSPIIQQSLISLSMAGTLVEAPALVYRRRTQEAFRFASRMRSTAHRHMLFAMKV